MTTTPTAIDLGMVPAQDPDRRLDLRGERCPATTAETVRVLDTLAPGEVLEVESDYVPARSTIPYHCDKRGLGYAFLEGSEPGSWRIRIAKR